jgi:hypothetical protein
VRRLASDETPGSDEACRLGWLAFAYALEQLEGRGLGVRDAQRLLPALADATGQLFEARERGLDERPYRDYLDQLYARFDRDPPLDELPPPPRRTFALRW